MNFIYSYKTSDGVRHEDEIEARTRDDAFAALRKQGIRPIRVEEVRLTTAQKRRRMVLWALAAALVLASAAGAWFAVRAAHARTRYQRETREAFLALQSRAEAERRRHQEEFAKVDFALLHNYALVERSQDVGFALDELAKGKGVIESSRSRVKELFRNLYEIFPPESANERLDAQRLYGEIMDEIDASEERLDAEECVLALLDENRGKWRVRQGRLVFDDLALERVVGFFRKDTDGSTMRWKRDFKQTPLESPVVELPSSSPAAGK